MAVLTYDSVEAYDSALWTYDGLPYRSHRPWGIDDVYPDRRPRYLSTPVPEGFPEVGAGKLTGGDVRV